MTCSTAPSTPVALMFWSADGAGRRDPRLQEAGEPLDCDGNGGFRAARLQVQGPGLQLDLVSPRPLRLWIDGDLVLDEPLSWRAFDRRLWATVLSPVEPGHVSLLFQFGPRPRHAGVVDRFSSSRNRAAVMARIDAEPDRLALDARTLASEPAAPVSLRHLPTQYWRDGVLHQHLLIRVGANRPARPPSIQA